jgi:hypothetical protein
MGVLTLLCYDSYGRWYESKARQPNAWSRLLKALSYGASFTSKAQRVQAMIIAWLAIAVGLVLLIVIVTLRPT